MNTKLSIAAASLVAIFSLNACYEEFIPPTFSGDRYSHDWDSLIGTKIDPKQTWNAAHSLTMDFVSPEPGVLSIYTVGLEPNTLLLRDNIKGTVTETFDFPQLVDELRFVCATASGTREVIRRPSQMTNKDQTLDFSLEGALMASPQTRAAVKPLEPDDNYGVLDRSQFGFVNTMMSLMPEHQDASLNSNFNTDFEFELTEPITVMPVYGNTNLEDNVVGYYYYPSTIEVPTANDLVLVPILNGPKSANNNSREIMKVVNERYDDIEVPYGQIRRTDIIHGTVTQDFAYDMLYVDGNRWNSDYEQTVKNNGYVLTLIVGEGQKPDRVYVKNDNDAFLDAYEGYQTVLGVPVTVILGEEKTSLLFNSNQDQIKKWEKAKTTTFATYRPFKYVNVKEADEIEIRAVRYDCDYPNRVGWLNYSVYSQYCKVTCSFKDDAYYVPGGATSNTLEGLKTILGNEYEVIEDQYNPGNYFYYTYTFKDENGVEHVRHSLDGDATTGLIKNQYGNVVYRYMKDEEFALNLQQNVYGTELKPFYYDGQWHNRWSVDYRTKEFQALTYTIPSKPGYKVGFYLSKKGFYTVYSNRRLNPEGKAYIGLVNDRSNSGYAFIGFDDWHDYDPGNDCNDEILMLNPGKTHPDPSVNKPTQEALQSWILTYEDQGTTGDFDFNDVIIRVTPQVDRTKDSNRTAKVELLTAGGILPSKVCFGEKNTGNYRVLAPEVHGCFGVARTTFVNTESYQRGPVVLVDDLEVPDDFTMEKYAAWFFIKSGESSLVSQDYISLSASAGCTPKALCIPGNSWYWPRERINISKAYPRFKDWSKDANNFDWYKDYDPDYVIIP